jgi:exodeoxyribonuclease VII large subunit
MKEKLEKEGLFERARKRPLPRYPRRIVVVTSPTGAAVRDFLQVVGRRWRDVELLIAPTRVQGEEAAGEIVAALGLANRVAGADLIVLTRGGGSQEDLWPFNTEPVARAIAGSRLPVVSAVGHEVDVTIADLVADARAATPSEAGERCVPDRIEQESRLGELAQRVERAGRRRLDEAQMRLDFLGDRLERAGRGRLQEARLVLDHRAEQLRSAWETGLERHRQQVLRLAAQLEALGPLAVLRRGFSVTQCADTGAVVRDAARLSLGQRLRTRLERGAVISRVEAIPADEVSDARRADHE